MIEIFKMTETELYTYRKVITINRQLVVIGVKEKKNIYHTDKGGDCSNCRDVESLKSIDISIQFEREYWRSRKTSSTSIILHIVVYRSEKISIFILFRLLEFYIETLNIA